MQQVPYPPSGPSRFGLRPAGGPGSPTPTWLSKNLGWVVSIGCLSMILFGCLILMSIFGAATTAMKSSDAYSMAMKAAEHDPIVAAALGAPLKVGWFVSGSVRVSGGAGHASLSIPVSGSAHSGKINAVAEKAAGVWSFSKLNVSVDGRPGVLDLLPKLSTPGTRLPTGASASASADANSRLPTSQTRTR